MAGQFRPAPLVVIAIVVVVTIGVIVVVVVAVIAVIAVIIAMVAAIVPMLVAMMLTIVRNVRVGVPVVLHEVDRLSAGVVLAAMVAPIPLIARANVQIDRRRQHAAGNAYTHDGRAIDEARRRRVAEIHASVESGIAQADRDSYLRGRCGADRQRGKAGGEK